MIPRGAPDIGWSDIFAGLAFCCGWDHPAQAAKRAESAWSPQADTLACLSVRTGLDLVLQAMAWPRGSEVLVSAVTIPDILYLLEQHGLVAVPLDIDPATLAVDAALIGRAASSRTKAVLVAHLFGSRMPLDEVARATEGLGLVLLEDCAQAYDGSSYRGHPGSDVSMFSFGPIKTATALGGALLRFRDPSLLARVRTLHGAYPRQTRTALLRRLLRFTGLKLLASPRPFSLFVAACQRRGIDHDQLISSSLRGFAGAELLPRIRQQPCVPLLRLLERRVRQGGARMVDARIRYARRLIAAMPQIQLPGAGAEHHTHWMLPVGSREPQRLIAHLRSHGFDATRHASSMTVVPAPPGRESLHPARAAGLMDALVYLPMYPRMQDADVERLARAVVEFELRAD